jgi:solute carrier family 25 (mitochondrial phosphate transporter), member 3
VFDDRHEDEPTFFKIQGGAKFSGYEYWKKFLVEISGDQETATKYRTAIYLSAASIGEYVILSSHPPDHQSKLRLGQILRRYPAYST